jgi:hypothetical protein
MATTIQGGPNGPYTITYPGNGCIIADSAESAQTYVTEDDWDTFETSLIPPEATYVTWQASFDDFVATVPTMSALAEWVGSNPPVAD